MGIQSPRLAATKTASANCVTKRIRAVGDWRTHTQMRPTINVWKQEHKAEEAERRKRWRANHLEQVRGRARRYYYAHQTERIGYARTYYTKRHETIKAKARLDYAKQPEVYKARWHNRRARLQGNGGDFTPRQWAHLVLAYGGICLCCAQRKPLTADHVISLSQGGLNDINNIQPLCLSCNVRKGTKTTDYRLLCINPS